MKIENVTIDGFAKEMKSTGKKIVIYGAGAIGKVTTLPLLADMGLLEQVLFFVDADPKKQNQKITVGNCSLEIFSPELLQDIEKDFVILITGSRYESILTYLNSKYFLKETMVYLLAGMLVEEARTFPKYDNIRRFDERLIPKKIHYCWFGNNDIPNEMLKCIESWKRYCPDYEILRWDESNYDIDKYIYTKQAYEHKKWAFVSDVARLDVLYQYGGIYFDTDVELIKNLDELLYQPAFVGVEKWRIINTGGGCGFIKEHPVIAELLDVCKKIEFVMKDDFLNLDANVSYESMLFMKKGFVPNNKVQIVNDMTIYSSDFFHPYDYMSGELCVTENTYGIHHFAETWI